MLQEVLAVLVKELPRFRYEPNRGSFRAWLRVVTTNRLRAFWRRREKGPKVIDHPDSLKMLNQLEDPASPLHQLWDQEHDRHVLRHFLKQAQSSFESTTWSAFHKVVLEEQPVRVVAAQLGISENAVLIAKSRVQRRLRQEIRGLID